MAIRGTFSGICLDLPLTPLSQSQAALRVAAFASEFKKPEAEFIPIQLQSK